MIWLSYADFISMKNNKSLAIQEQVVDHGYDLFIFDGPMGYKTEAGGADKTDYETNYRSGANQKLVITDVEGIPKAAVEKPVRDFNTVVTHNFADTSTWVVSPTDSTWQLKPSSGVNYQIVKSECQFEHDIVLNSTNELYFNYYVWHPAHPTDAILGLTITFDHIRRLFELGNQHYHCPAIRTQISSGLTTIEFSYPSKLLLLGDRPASPIGELAYIEIQTKGHNSLGGSYATVGFVVE